MWWKLLGLLAVTTAVILSVIPIRTHAVMYDPLREPPPPPPSFWEMVSNMYLTTGTKVAIAIILSLACVVAVKVVRGDW